MGVELALTGRVVSGLCAWTMDMARESTIDNSARGDWHVSPAPSLLAHTCFTVSSAHNCLHDSVQVVGAACRLAMSCHQGAYFRKAELARAAWRELQEGTEVDMCNRGVFGAATEHGCSWVASCSPSFKSSHETLTFCRSFGRPLQEPAFRFLDAELRSELPT